MSCCFIAEENEPNVVKSTFSSTETGLERIDEELSLSGSFLMSVSGLRPRLRFRLWNWDFSKLLLPLKSGTSSTIIFSTSTVGMSSAGGTVLSPSCPAGSLLLRDVLLLSSFLDQSDQFVCSLSLVSSWSICLDNIRLLLLS